MSEPVLCKLCGQRRARRTCPAIQADICTVCCGTEREVSISCPLECEYLTLGHRHEKSIPVDPKLVIEPAFQVSEDFLRSHEEFLLFCIYAVLQAALRTEGAVDSDVLAALDALIKTHHTSESGLIYETRAENPVAAGVQRRFAESLADYQKERTLRAADILGMLIFLRRFGQQNLNGRPRGRMFVDLLRHMTPDKGIEKQASGILLA